jgi:hypothetical protein
MYMKAVIRAPSFLKSAADAGLGEDEQMSMVTTIAADPNLGDVMVGTGGCRKCRFAGRGKGKRGGYRTVHYNGADDVPVLLLVVMDKGDRDNLDQAERNELRQLMQTYEAEYRAGVRGKITKLAEGA